MDISKVELEIKRLRDEKEKIDLINTYCKQFFKIDKSYAEKLLTRARSLALKYGYDKGLAVATINRAISEMYSANYTEVLLRLEEAEELINKLNSAEPAEITRIYNLRGVVYSIFRDYLHAAESYKKALAASEDSSDFQSVGDIYNNLSLIYEEIDRTDLAIDYLSKAVDYNKQSNNYKGLIINLANLARLFQQSDRYSEALEYLEEAKACVQNVEDIELTPNIHMLYGKSYLRLGEGERALEEYLKGIEMAERSKDPFELANITLEISRYYLLNTEYDILFQYLEKAAKIIKKYNIEVLNRELYELYWNYYERRGRYKKAIYYLKKSFDCEMERYNFEIERNIKNIDSESLKKSNQTISLISRIGREITATLDLKRLLIMIYDNINSLMDVSIFGIAGYKRESRKIIFDMFVEQGKVLPLMSTELDSPRSLIALAIREGRDIVMNDLDREISDYLEESPLLWNTNVGEFNKQRPQSLIIIPFYAEGEVTGALTVQSYRKAAYTLFELDALKVLSSYISIALTNARKAEVIKEQNRALKKMSITDALTGIYNRREFEKRLKIIWDLSGGKNSSFSILMLDIDHFKAVNDNYGHLAGDHCLKVVAAIFNHNICGDSSFLARYGGEEFIILLQAERDEALLVAEKIRGEVAATPINYEDNSFKVTVSIGVTTVTITHGDNTFGPEKCIALADSALYRSKEGGRNRVTFAEI